MSPFSLPVMQLGFDNYIELLYYHRELYNQLIEKNIAFCTDWANAQLEAGATAICYFDPVSSSTIIPRDFYLNTGFIAAQKTISNIKGPTATHLASGITLPLIDDIKNTGTLIIGAGPLDNITELKKQCKNKLTILGNLNGIEMCRWNKTETENIVNNLLNIAAPGGGFILSDSHGEIPYQVDQKILLTISKTVSNWSKSNLKLSSQTI